MPEPPLDLPATGVLYGPDCSSFQAHPDWGRVRASGCVIGGYKVSEGRTYQDPSHQYNRAAVPAAGLIPLAYHYLYYGAEYAGRPDLFAAQAAFFVSLADPAALHVLDVEAPAPAGRMDVKAWVAEYRRRLPGHKLGLYANRSLWTNRSGVGYDPTMFDFLWHAGIGDGYYTAAKGSIQAQWAGTSSLRNSFAGHGFDSCDLWQITDHAAVSGVPGTCDGNAYTGTVADLRALITTGDDMSQADVDAIKAYIDQKVGGVPAAVWNYPIGSAWDPDDPQQSAAKAARSTQRYAIYAGYEGVLPGTDIPTLARRLLAAAGDEPTLPQITAATGDALRGLVPGVTDAVIAGIRDALPDTLEVDYEQVAARVSVELDKHFRSFTVGTDTPAPTE